MFDQTKLNRCRPAGLCTYRLFIISTGYRERRELNFASVFEPWKANVNFMLNHSYVCEQKRREETREEQLIFIYLLELWQDTYINDIHDTWIELEGQWQISSVQFAIESLAIEYNDERKEKRKNLEEAQTIYPTRWTFLLLKHLQTSFYLSHRDKKTFFNRRDKNHCHGYKQQSEINVDFIFSFVQS